MKRMEQLLARKRWSLSERSDWIITGIRRTGIYRKCGFIRQLELARQLDLPVIIHSRGSSRRYDGDYEAVCRRIKRCDPLFFLFPEQAKEYVKMGFYLGIGGVVTFKNAKKLKKWCRRSLWSHWFLRRTARIWLLFESWKT